MTYESLSADLAWQLKKEGHEVKMYCHGQGEKDVGLGFFEKVDEWEPLKDWADVISLRRHRVRVEGRAASERRKARLRRVHLHRQARARQGVRTVGAESGRGRHTAELELHVVRRGD